MFLRVVSFYRFRAIDSEDESLEFSSWPRSNLSTFRYTLAVSPSRRQFGAACTNSLMNSWFLLVEGARVQTSLCYGSAAGIAPDGLPLFPSPFPPHFRNDPRAPSYFSSDSSLLAQKTIPRAVNRPARTNNRMKYELYTVIICVSWPKSRLFSFRLSPISFTESNFRKYRVGRVIQGIIS